MAPPPIQVFLTTIASQVELRRRQEYLLRLLQVKKIPFTSYDLASDEDAKRLWKRKAPTDKQQLPGFLVGGDFIGTFSQFEEAVEFDELEIFLRRNEDYQPFVDEPPVAPQQAIGVPGAYSPLQMFPKHAPSRSPSPSPQALREKEKSEINAGEELAEFGLANVSVSKDELAALVAELGLGGDEAKDLVAGLAEPMEPPRTIAKAAAKVAKAEENAKGKAEPKPKMPKVVVKDEREVKKEVSKEVREEAKEAQKEAKKEAKEAAKEEIQQPAKEEKVEEDLVEKKTEEDVKLELEPETPQTLVAVEVEAVKPVVKVKDEDEVTVELKPDEEFEVTPEPKAEPESVEERKTTKPAPKEENEKREDVEVVRSPIAVETPPPKDEPAHE
ncbi:hypothetical protein PsYK624_037160 [Phanerochaete sordida]|uniref:SH3 domain-binding glutamic acid-rich protein n=1 Tax=Phanerochaete sordida TaxID=48140 RepID=A0A9P3G262_9APHY|nr:hypothetical protein PsYK624_037160 [Phanerochaete sordida]